MIYKWQHQSSRAIHVVVFFNGWGLDNTIIANLLTNTDTDVLVVSDYTNIENKLPDLSLYDTRTLIAWSFGVANYTLWQQNRPDIFDTKIAINGTMQGIDRYAGIAGVVVQHTIDTLNLDSFVEFSKRCCNSSNMTINASNVDISTKKNELQHIKDRRYVVDNTIPWDAIWISKQDKIFPTKNQLRAWQYYQPNLIDAAHAPFTYWVNWQDLLPISK